MNWLAALNGKKWPVLAFVFAAGGFVYESRQNREGVAAAQAEVASLRSYMVEWTSGRDLEIERLKGENRLRQAEIEHLREKVRWVERRLWPGEIPTSSERATFP